MNIKIKKSKLLIFIPLLLIHCYNTYLQKAVIYSPVPDDQIVVSKNRESGDLTAGIDIKYE